MRPNLVNFLADAVCFTLVLGTMLAVVIGILLW